MEKREVEAIIREVISLPEGDAEIGYGLIPEWSSASHINIVIALEERLNLVFEADDIVEMTSIDNIVRIISQRK